MILSYEWGGPSGQPSGAVRNDNAVHRMGRTAARCPGRAGSRGIRDCLIQNTTQGSNAVFAQQLSAFLCYCAVVSIYVAIEIVVPRSVC